MTQTANAISPTYRTTIKANNITIWFIESSSGHTYQVTIFEGKATSCQREDGVSCPGFAHRGTCHHASLALSRESERNPQPVERALPTLNGNGHERKMEVAPSGHAVWMR